MQDGIPDWASHVAFVEPSTMSNSNFWVVRTGKADKMKDRIVRYQEEVSASSSAAALQPLIRSSGEVLVELKDVSVSYHERKVSISSFVLPITRHKLLRCCKIRTGQSEQVKGGTSRDRTVCLKRIHIYYFWSGCSIVPRRLWEDHTSVSSHRRSPTILHPACTFLAQPLW